tara:strand:- start:139 stop:390 length:252 start_codon:yes stop_codon:yes gene_type:complete
MPLTERNKMTDREKKCKDLVSSEWKDRQKDLTKEDFEGLSFDYVEANTFTNQKEGYTGAGSFPGVDRATSSVRMLTGTTLCIA